MDSKSKEYYLSYEKRRNLGTLLLLNSPKKNAIWNRFISMGNR